MTTSAQNHKDLVTLRDYFESRLDAIKATMDASGKAMEIRLETMNEFRAQINNERGLYIPRIEHESVHTSLNNDIRMLRESKASLDGKASMSSVYLSYVVGIAGVLFGVINLVVTLIR